MKSGSEKPNCPEFGDSDNRIRIHRAQEDSGQGEGERTNSAVGDASLYRWRYYKMRIFFMTNQTKIIKKMAVTS